MIDRLSCAVYVTGVPAEKHGNSFPVSGKKEVFMMSSGSQRIPLPYKNLAVGLVFTILLGPLGLLYASFWGGVILMPLAIYTIFNQFYALALLIWIACCMWSVRAIETYNRQLMQVVNVQ
jgi:hypothetical protein